MPNVKQLTVMDQNRGMINGHETCSYHTTKNTVLAILNSQGILNNQQYETLRTDCDFFNAFYIATIQYSNALDDRRAYRNLNVADDGEVTTALFQKLYRALYFATVDVYDTLQKHHGNLDINSILKLMETDGTIDNGQGEMLSRKPGLLRQVQNEIKTRVAGRETDLSLWEMERLLRRIKKGDFDFSTHGLSKAAMQKVDLGKISAFNFLSYPNAPSPGLLGGEDDLSEAALLAKLARSKGEVTQALAVGINNQHWVTAVVKKDSRGQYSWDFMDSYSNQRTYRISIPAKFENVLNKNETQLKEYLLESYINSSDLLDKKYDYFFDKVTGLPKPDILIDVNDDANLILNVKQFFVENSETREMYSNFIEKRFAFMETVDFLTSNDPEVQVRIKQLYSLTNFMVKNMDQTDVIRKKLEPICSRLEAAMPQVAVKEKQVPVDTKAKNVVVPGDTQAKKTTTTTVNSQVDKQTKAAQFAAENGEP